MLKVVDQVAVLGASLGRPLRIACDFDGVVGNLMPEWLRRWNLDHPDKRLSYNQITGWDVERFTGGDKSIYKYLSDPDLYACVDPLEGALKGIQKIRAAGHQIAFTSSCTARTTDQKVQWLKRHAFTISDNPYSEFVPVNDKSWIKADCMIDDGIHNLETFQGALGLLVDQPWNQKEDRWPRVEW